MKKFICIVASFLYVVFWFYIGTTFFPFIAWLLDTRVPIVPFVLCLFIVASLFIDAFVSDYSKKKNKNWLIEKIPPMAWFPPIVCLLISAFYLGQRYNDRTYNQYGRIQTEYAGWWSDRHGLANKWGNDVYRSHCYRVADCGDYAIVYYYDDKSKIISLPDKRTLLPKGSSLLTYGEVFEEYGLYGIRTKGGDVIIPAEYEEIKPLDNFYMYKKNGKYGTISKTASVREAKYDDIDNCYDKLHIVKEDDKYGLLDNENGHELLRPQYKNYEVKSNDYSQNDKHPYYVIMEDNDSCYYVYKGNSSNPCFETEYEIVEIVHDDYFIVKNSDEEYGVRKGNGAVIKVMEYDEISGKSYGFLCESYFEEFDPEYGQYVTFAKREKYDFEGNYIGLDN